VITEVRVIDAQYEAPKQVDFLMTSDQHPNTRGAVDLGFVSSGKISDIVSDFNKGGIDLLVVIKENIPEGIQQGKGLVVVLHTNITASVKDADIAVPIKAFTEQSGTFTNKNGVKQEFEAAMNPVLGMPSSGDFFRRLSLELTRKEEVLVGNH
jgi:NADH-quinone oxidoreductase subunit G